MNIEKRATGTLVVQIGKHRWLRWESFKERAKIAWQILKGEGWILTDVDIEGPGASFESGELAVMRNCTMSCKK